MEKFYKMYPEARSRLEVYERRGRQCSFVVPQSSDLPDSPGGYEHMIRGWMGQSTPSGSPEISPKTRSTTDAIPTTVAKQFAR